MNNEQVRKVIEKAGYRVTANMGFEDDQEVIVSYSARLRTSKVAGHHTAPSLYELMEDLGLLLMVTT